MGHITILSHLVISLLDGFFQLQFLGLFFFVTLFAGSLELFGSKLEVEKMFFHTGH